jgi:putative tricarboxylic transport membrane protein
VNSTLILGIASIAFALVFRAQTIDLPEQAQRLPALLIWIVILLGVLMIVEDVAMRRKARRMQSGGAAAGALADDEDPPAAPINWAVLAVFATAIAGYVALIPLAGYLLVTPTFLIGGLLVSRTVPLGKAAAIGLAATALVWAVFIWALNLPVPLLPAFAR